MANTLKFGNGEWYGKKDTILAYNDENSNYKPLPFNFSRASKATVVNKDGLIEEVGSGQPRIDYKDDSKGALLLEPSRSNAITNSETFGSTGWGFVTTGTVIAPIVTNDYAISPDGTQNAQRIQFDLNGGTTSSDRTVIRQSIGTQNDWFLSVWMKSTNGAEQKILWHTTADSNETIVTGEWKRFTFSRNGVSNSWVGLGLRGGTSGVDTADILVYGFQAEQGSYPTSYIPTSGSAITRLADSCSQTVPDGVIGQTEGTMYAEYYFDATIDNAGGSDRDIVSINDGTFNNIIQLVHYGNGVGSAYKSVYLNARLSSSYVVSIASSAYDSGLMKVAGAYKNNDYVLYVNGVQIGTDTNASVPSCSVINFAKITGTETPTPINDLKLYNTRLSNAELAALTQV